MAITTSVALERCVPLQGREKDGKVCEVSSQVITGVCLSNWETMGELIFPLHERDVTIVEVPVDAVLPVRVVENYASVLVEPVPDKDHARGRG